MRLLSILIILLLSSIVSLGQIIQNGTYVGYEQNPFCYKQQCMIIHDTTSKETKQKLYFEVTLTVSDSLIFIKKIPIFFYTKKDSLPRYDSAAGGYYSYNLSTGRGKIGDRIRWDYISGNLINCKYCRPCGIAICRYVRVLYECRKSGQDLLMDSEFEKNILFEKQNKDVIVTTHCTKRNRTYNN